MDSLRDLFSGFKLPLALCLVGLVLILGGMFLSQSPKTKTIPKESLVQTNMAVKVDISGAVLNPGVYDMSPEDRIEDVIKKAGGLRQEVNQEYVSKYLNLAQKVVDGSKIYIPFKNERYVLGANTSSKVNINTSSSQDLEKLSGIGAVTASKIISARPFNSIEDLINKKILSKSVFEKIKDQIVVY